MAVRFRPQPEWLILRIVLIIFLFSFFEAIAYNNEYNQTILDGDFVSVSDDPMEESTEKNQNKIADFQFGSTALMNAIINNDHSAALSILENGTNPNDSDNAGVTALHFAAVYNMNNIVSELLHKGAEINKTTMNNLTPLMYAASFGNKNIVKNLIDHNANINIVSVEEKTAIDYAIQSNNIDAIKYIAKKINTMSKSQIEQTIEYAKKSPKSEQILSIINNELFQKAEKNEDLNSKVEQNIKNIEKNNYTKKNLEKTKHILTKDNKKYKNSYYILYFGAFTNVNDAISYWNIIKSKHRWLNHLYYNTKKEQFYVNKKNFHDLFIGVFNNEKDAQDIQEILAHNNISVTVLPLQEKPDNMKIVNIKKIKDSIIKETNIQEKKENNIDKINTIENVKETIDSIEDIVTNDTIRYVLDFGIFINNAHAEKYWSNISQIQWLSVLHPIYDTAIHNNIDKTVISLKAGFMIDQELSRNMKNILNSVGVRVKLLPLNYTPEGMLLISKNNLFNKFHYSSYYPENITEQTNNKNKQFKIEVKEAIPFEDNINNTNLFTKKNTNIKVSSYKNRYASAIAIAKANRYFKINQHAVKINSNKRAIVYLTISNTTVNAACNYFIEQGYNCINLEENE